MPDHCPQSANVRRHTHLRHRTAPTGQRSLAHLGLPQAASGRIRPVISCLGALRRDSPDLPTARSAGRLAFRDCPRDAASYRPVGHARTRCTSAGTI